MHLNCNNTQVTLSLYRQNLYISRACARVYAYTYLYIYIYIYNFNQTAPLTPKQMYVCCKLCTVTIPEYIRAK